MSSSVSSSVASGEKSLEEMTHFLHPTYKIIEAGKYNEDMPAITHNVKVASYWETPSFTDDGRVNNQYYKLTVKLPYNAWNAGAGYIKFPFTVPFMVRKTSVAKLDISVNVSGLATNHGSGTDTVLYTMNVGSTNIASNDGNLYKVSLSPGTAGGLQRNTFSYETDTTLFDDLFFSFFYQFNLVYQNHDYRTADPTIEFLIYNMGFEL